MPSPSTAHDVLAKHVKETTEQTLAKAIAENVIMATGLLELGDLKLAGEKYILAGKLCQRLAETRGQP